MTKVISVFNNESTRILEVPVFSATLVQQAVGPRLDMVALNAPTSQQAHEAAESLSLDVLHEEISTDGSQGVHTQLVGVIAKSLDGQRDATLSSLARNAYEGHFSPEELEAESTGTQAEREAFTYLKAYQFDDQHRIDAWYTALQYASEALDLYLAGKRQ